MVKFFKYLLLLFLVFALTVKAESPEDPISTSEDENIETDEGDVEEEKMKRDIVTDITDTASAEKDEQTIVDGVPVASKNVEIQMMFVEPALNKRSNGAGVELPANKIAKVLVSFANNELEIADQELKSYKLDYVEGYLRYPSDFSYFLQNFTVKALDLKVEPRREATIDYSFVPAQQLAGRPFGLTLRLAYHDEIGKLFTSTFFNDTVQIVEVDEGFDTESLFLYLLVIAVVGLGIFGAYHLLNVYALRKFKKSTTQVKQPVDLSGTTLKSELDLQWIPKEHLKSRQSPTLSPRKRKNRRHEDNHVTGH